jgi:hypothetical protein
MLGEWFALSVTRADFAAYASVTRLRARPHIGADNDQRRCEAA